MPLLTGDWTALWNASKQKHVLATTDSKSRPKAAVPASSRTLPADEERPKRQSRQNYRVLLWILAKRGYSVPSPLSVVAVRLVCIHLTANPSSERQQVGDEKHGQAPLTCGFGVWPPWAAALLALDSFNAKSCLERKAS